MNTQIYEKYSVEEVPKKRGCLKTRDSLLKINKIQSFVLFNNHFVGNGFVIVFYGIEVNTGGKLACVNNKTIAAGGEV